MSYTIISSKKAGAKTRQIEDPKEALSEASEMVRQGARELMLINEQNGEVLEGGQIPAAWNSLLQRQSH
jgi:hypothetical protein